MSYVSEGSPSSPVCRSCSAVTTRRMPFAAKIPSTSNSRTTTAHDPGHGCLPSSWYQSTASRAPSSDSNWRTAMTTCGSPRECSPSLPGRYRVPMIARTNPASVRNSLASGGVALNKKSWVSSTNSSTLSKLCLPPSTGSGSYPGVSPARKKRWSRVSGASFPPPHAATPSTAARLSTTSRARTGTDSIAPARASRGCDRAAASAQDHLFDSMSNHIATSGLSCR
jgi:hypothetical protein